jgi:hypothetical protein
MTTTHSTVRCMVPSLRLLCGGVRVRPQQGSSRRRARQEDVSPWETLVPPALAVSRRPRNFRARFVETRGNCLPSPSPRPRGFRLASPRGLTLALALRYPCLSLTGWACQKLWGMGPLVRPPGARGLPQHRHPSLPAGSCGFVRQPTRPRHMQAASECDDRDWRPRRRFAVSVGGASVEQQANGSLARAWRPQDVSREPVSSCRSAKGAAGGS